MGSIRTAVLLAVALAAAGCVSLAANEPLATNSLPAGVAGFVTAERAFKALESDRWTSVELKALDQGGEITDFNPTDAQYVPCWFFGMNCPDWEPPTCEVGKNCERREFTLTVPATGSDVTRTLEFSIRWPTTFSQWTIIWIEDEAGEKHWGTNGFIGAVAQIDDPKPGKYTAVALMTWGKGSFEGVIQLEEKPKETAVRELLPNLIVLPPTDLRIETPTTNPSPLGGMVPSGWWVDATGSKGCATDERFEDLATKCLRFSNAVGNLGEGTLEIHLSFADAATHAAGGKFVQRVYKTDGTYTDVPSGAAEFHVVHNHWHNAAANSYALHKYDWATKARLEEVGQGYKGGVCFGDVGLIDLGLPNTGKPAHWGEECWNPTTKGEWMMGLAPNWYDLYTWQLSDQYIDIAEFEDGVYELVSRTNVNGALKETSPDDNEASTVFRLTGDKIEILTPQPYHAAPK